MTTHNYRISKCYEMKGWLEWAESCQRTVITAAMVTALDNSSGMSNVDATTTSARLWGYLNLSLKDTTKMTGFNHGEILNGFDAWRRLVVPLKPRTDAKRIDMHSSVHNPGRSSNLLGDEAGH